MIYFSERQFATFWSIKDAGEKHSVCSVSTSRKDKEGNYKNSNWYMSFVGNAHAKVQELDKKTKIILKGGLSLEPYIKNGEEMYPKTPRFVVFDFDFPDSSSSRTGFDAPPKVEDDDEEMPF